MPRRFRFFRLSVQVLGAALAGMLVSGAGAAGLDAPAPLTAPPVLAAGAPPLRLERVVMLIRHGVRAPLAGEAAVPGLVSDPWPSWDAVPSHLTAHGYQAARLMGAYQRRLLAAQGLLPADGCPAAGTVAIWTNSVERTIRTGDAMAEGLAPGCPLPVAHLPLDRRDPLFDPFEAGAATVDGAQAVAAIRRQIGDPAALTAPYGAEIGLIERALGCRRHQPPCDIAADPTRITAAADNRGIDLSGAVNTTSGTAQVLVLQYLEGMPPDQVAWGRLGRDDLTRVSRLHALLFEVYARPAYMARRKAVALAPRLLAALRDPAAPPVTLLVGHDDNIAAVAGLLGAHFQVDSYGQDDPPVGGGLRLELWRDAATGAAYVRAAYQAQTMDQVRELRPLSLTAPPSTQVLRIPACALPGADLCRLDDVAALLTPTAP